MMSGGLFEGDSCLVAGPSGTGKSALATQCNCALANRTYSGIKMRRQIREADSITKKVEYILEHGDRIQEPGYCNPCIFLVLRAMLRGLRDVEFVVKKPPGSRLSKAMDSIKSAGVEILKGAVISAGSSAVTGAIGHAWKASSKAGGAKKAVKKTAKKSAKRGSAA